MRKDKKDKKDKNVKQVSRLTGALLAKKGSARPSQASLMMNQTANSSHKSHNELVKDVIKGQSSANKVKISHEKTESTVSSKDSAVCKRIAMTLRMDGEDHLKLRIFSAHTRKSCQAIISEALDLYLAENNDKIPLLKIASQNR